MRSVANPMIFDHPPEEDSPERIFGQQLKHLLAITIAELAHRFLSNCRTGPARKKCAHNAPMMIPLWIILCFEVRDSFTPSPQSKTATYQPSSMRSSVGVILVVASPLVRIAWPTATLAVRPSRL